MAKLSAHGKEIGTIDYRLFRLRYMSDGQVLRNRGDGWKLYATVKAGLAPAAAFAASLDKHQAFLKDHPHYAAYCKALHQAGGVYSWGIIDVLISTMPDDPDGVCVETQDSYDYKLAKLTLDEAVELCKLYKLVELERQELKAGKEG